jgi:hypothetical protein
MSGKPDWGLLTADRGAAFDAQIDEIRAGQWRASARVSLSRIRAVIDDTIGPQTFASEAAARAWLENAAQARGFTAPHIDVHRAK